MTDASDTGDAAKAETLIAQINAANEAEIAKLRAEATETGKAIRGAAHARARQRMSREIAELRRERDRAILSAKAQIETARRHIRQEQHRETIERTAPVLAEVLAEFWRSDDIRRAWALKAVEEAAGRHVPGAWSVEHPGLWTAADAAAVTRAIEAVAGSVPAFTKDPALRAGLRIRAGSACLDASDTALLADPQDLGARLLAASAAGEDRG